MTKIGIDYDLLKSTDPTLYHFVQAQSGFQTGFHEVEINAFSKTIRQQLTNWFKRQATAARAAQPAPPQEEQVSVSEEFKRDLQRQIDTTAGINRLQQHVEQGLEPSEHNKNAVIAWLQQNAKGYLSAAGVDAAIANLGPRGANVLRWTQKATVAPPPPAVEVLETLPNGEKQLPLNADSHTMRRASKTQLLDLAARQRALKQSQNRHGWFGASL